MYRRIASGVAAVLVAGLAVTAGHAEAAPGNGKGPNKANTESTASIALDQNAPHLGDWVTFTTTIPGGVGTPLIGINCYQGEIKVSGDSGPADSSFQLGGGWSLWTERGGEAACEAVLFSWKNLKNTNIEKVVYATTYFVAQG